MLLVAGFPLLLTFVPIVLVEAAVFRWKAGTRWWRSVGVMTIANLVSTFVGVPITWIALVVVQMSGEGLGMQRFVGPLWRSAWLGPPPARDFDLSLLYGAALVLTVPFYITSVVTEWTVAHEMVEQERKPRVFRAILLANTATYVPIAAYWIYQLIATPKA